MNPSERIRSTTRGYFAVVREALTAEEYSALSRLQGPELAEWVGAQTRAGGAFADPRAQQSAFTRTESGLFVPGNLRNSFEIRFDRLAREIGRYWAENGASLLEALLVEAGYSLLLPLRGEFSMDLDGTVRRLGVYFDTIVIVDPLHVPAEDLESVLSAEDSAAQRALRAQRLGYLLKVERLVSDAAGPNIFALIPSYLGAKVSTEEVVGFLGQVFEPGCDDATAMRLVVGAMRPDRQPPPQIKNPELWEQLLERFGRSLRPGISLQMPAEGLTSENRALVQTMSRDLRAATLGDAVQTLLLDVDSSIYVLRESVGNAMLVDADPVVYGPDAFLADWLRTRLARSDTSGLEASVKHETQGTVRALLHERTNFLEAVSLEDLWRLRSDGVLEDLRQTLRNDRKSIRATTFNSTLDHERAFLDRLFSSLDAFEEGTKALAAKHRQGLRGSHQSLGLSVALGGLGLVLPPVQLLQMLVTGVGVLVGGQSVKDFFDTKARQSEERRTRQTSAIGILYSAYSR